MRTKAQFRSMFVVAVASGAMVVGASRQSPLAGVSGCASVLSHSCTELGCEQGVKDDFTYREAGNYVFDVVVDGTKTVCTARLPLDSSTSASGASGCDTEGVYLGLVGSQLPPAEQYISGIHLATISAKNMSIVATRDGVLLGESSVVIPYKTTPGPNGEGCEPSQCTFASYTFP